MCPQRSSANAGLPRRHQDLLSCLLPLEAAFAIGNFLGNSLAGLLFDNIGWEWSCTAVRGLISLTLVLSLSWQDKTIKSLPREDQSRRQEKDEGAQTWRRTNKDSWRLTKSLFFGCLLQQIVSCGWSGCILCINVIKMTVRGTMVRSEVCDSLCFCLES